MFTSATGDPLVFDLPTFLEDAAMHGTIGGIMETSDGERRMPGVGFSGRDLCVDVESELGARRIGWRAAGEVMLLLHPIRLQEEQLAERRLGKIESDQGGLESDLI